MYLPLLLLWVLSPDASAFPAAHHSFVGHSVGVDARAHEGAEARNRDLAGAARGAAKTLAEHLQGPGYWLTAHTGEAGFEKPSQEMNTFTNAVLVDILDPVAERAGITGLVSRARAFLGNQIEADGLVRYHGRPDAPTIRSLGCVITPDADDTALVWRIAPVADRELLAKALAKLGQYRAANGLYKTWLAPQDRFECIGINPGKDPNPTDMAIQMHVLMWLAQVDRPAARALCEALAKESSSDNVWVYYRIAPLIPLLRLADLHKSGCPLQLPQSRSHTTVPGQALWVEVAHLLGRIERAEATAADRSRAADLLHQLATSEFSLVKSAPPLLYHNDFTAHAKRFYWSEDVGYALWLRLYSAM